VLEVEDHRVAQVRLDRQEVASASQQN